MKRLQRVLEALASRRQALAQKEKRLIASLDRQLRELGYRVVERGPGSGPGTSAADGRYRCADCGREFGHWLHLGRHRSTAHARGKSRRVA